MVEGCWTKDGRYRMLNKEIDFSRTLDNGMGDSRTLDKGMDGSRMLDNGMDDYFPIGTASGPNLE